MGSIFSTLTGGLLGGDTGSKAPPPTPMIDTPPPPTIDEARQAADAQAAAEKRQGRLSNIFTPSANSDQLGGNTANTFTKKLLGQ